VRFDWLRKLFPFRRKEESPSLGFIILISHEGNYYPVLNRTKGIGVIALFNSRQEAEDGRLSIQVCREKDSFILEVKR
jgi:hypothetical protein